MTRHILLGEPLLRHQLDEDLAQVATSQLSLGKEELLRGRLVKGWQVLQHQAFKNYAPWMKGLSWSANVIKALWSLSFFIWQGRNEILHQSEVQDKLLNMDNIDLAILEEWGMGETGLHEKDKFLFRGVSQDELLAKASRYRREWLICVQAARYGGEQQEDMTQNDD
jgi:hypothetical protein